MAEAFCISAASNAVGTLMVKPVDYLLKLVERPLRYLFRLEKIVEELQKQKKNLTKEQTRVQEDVREATSHIQPQVIEEYVEKWLTDAENVLKEAQSLQERIEENERCFRWCPNWGWRYQLSKKIEQKTQAIRILVESSKFERVGHCATLPGIEFFESKGYLASNSSKSSFDKIMKALTDDRVNRIGVWGMGGVGKTTLVIEVGKKVQDFQLFDRVIRVVVSQEPDVGNIQNKILAEFIDNFDQIKQMDMEHKAKQLWVRLEKEKKVLIILDDLWDELDLKKIGISLDGNHKGCKIILTTRRQQVCESMESQVTVQLGVMEEAEAWKLFKMKACLDSASPNPDIIGVAKKVAKECGGLPIAIVTLARALRHKGLNRWKLAFHKLEQSRLMDIELIPKDVHRNAYLCLEMSYQYLGRETTKRCFLLCALYPEDYSIDVEDLVRYAWALRLYQDADSIQDVRSEVFEAIDILKDTCLLSEDDDEKRNIKLHDVVRDVALWIASKEDNGLVTKSGVESENESSKQKLQILLLDDNNSKTPIDGFDFEGMPELKVLSLRRKANDWDSRFSLNPLKSLTNLVALHVEGFYRLEDISALAKLTNLEILCLHHFGFRGSTYKLGELKKLKVLDIRKCNYSFNISPDLIRMLVKVEELYLSESLGGDIAAFLPQLNLLPRLATLVLEVPFAVLPKDFVFPRLNRYDIAIGTYDMDLRGAIAASRMRDLDPISFKVLTISDSEGLPLNAISELLPNVEFLALSDIEGKDIKFLTESDTTPETVSVATILKNLKGVSIERCENLRVIFQMKNAENPEFLLSQLKDLRLLLLYDMEYIWKMPTQHISLRSLEAVEIYDCWGLKSLFSFSLAHSLECLEKLEIHGCGELRQIVEESEGDEQEISPNLNPDKPLCLPKLRYMKISWCYGLEYIFPKFMAPEGLPQLQQLSLEDLSQLKQICRPAKRREENGILLPQLQLLPSLTNLTLHNCPKLTDAAIHSEPIWASSRGIQLSKLKVSIVTTKSLSLMSIRIHNLIPEIDGEGLNELTSLDLRFCDSLEYLVDTTKEHVPNRAFSNLVYLSLEQMDGLKMLCNGQFPMGFLQNLKNLKVRGCGQLQIDEENQAQLFSNLEHLEVSWLPELRTLAHYFTLRNLKVVKIYGCKKLKSVFSPSLIQNPLQLEKLKIHDSDELETLFAKLESYGETESNSCLDPLCLQRLKTLRINRCARLEYVLPITLAQGLPQLEQLLIDSCGELKTVFAEQESHNETESNNHLRSLCLPRLKALRISECPGLEYVLPITLPQGLPQLEDLLIDSCGELKTVFVEQESHNETESNNHLRSLCLPTLKTLRIYRCARLEYVLPITLAEGLPQLEELLIDSCGELKTVIAEKESDGETDSNNHLRSLCLPRLKTLRIYRCARLEYVLPITLAQSLPQLEILKIDSCGELKTVFAEQESDSETESNNHLHSLCLPRLKTLRIYRCARLEYVLPITLAQSLPQLEILKIDSCGELKTVFAEQESDSETESNNHLHSLCLPRLKTLRIYRCARLEYVLPITLALSLLQLEELLINSYGEQESDSEWDEESISPQLKQVFGVAKQHDGVEHCIKLPCLKYLQLHYLTNLSCFGPQNYFFEAPAFKNISVYADRRLMPVNSGVQLQGVPLSAFKSILPNANYLSLDSIAGHKNLIPDAVVDLQGLTSLRLTDCKDLECLTDTTDEEHVPTSGAFTNLAELVMLNLISLTMLCNGQPPRGFLQNLERLMVQGCSKLEEIFGIEELLCTREENQAPLLSNLGFLQVRSMSELRWMVKGPTQYVSLQSLKDVSIYECNKLESLFSSSLIPSLRLLENLRIINCEKLEQIIVNDDTSASSSQGREKEMLMFPQLQTLHLGKLPSLMSFSRVGYHLVFPSLKSLEIKDCSRMITSFTVDSTEFVHAETKASGPDDATPSKRDIFWLRHYRPDSLPAYAKEEDEI